MITYVRSNLPYFFDPSASLKASELSDGNINYVFRVEDENTGKSLIVKHAMEDMKGYENLRYELCAHHTFPNLAQDVADFCDSFRVRARELMKQKLNDRMMSSDAFFDAYLDDIFRDQAGFAGTELIRRTVGTSKVKDITSIEGGQARAKAEMLCLKAGMAFVTSPEDFKSGRDYTSFLSEVRNVKVKK